MVSQGAQHKSIKVIRQQNHLNFSKRQNAQLPKSGYAFVVSSSMALLWRTIVP
ncbi:UNKNOWN [Stylonychia lemnae]|uniref:Uncharacterized protein n=1 Tax=Stylonychia lemnae TaxID=5949 RepID=A0A078A323_STYLE|nr:UNKNOWN [Stylonychia lemnae]|eukprot:CDW76562.1 UNKNOWN [Stylonychia lemnae]